MKVRLFLLSALAGLSFSNQTVAQQQRNWTVNDSFKTKSIQDLQASPAENDLIFVVSQKNLDQNTSYSVIYSWSDQGKELKALTSESGHASSPRWAPDGQKIAYFDTDSSGMGLWVMDKDGSGKKKLTGLEMSNAYLLYSGPENKLCWSPDGKQLAYSAAGPRFYKEDLDPPHLPTGNDVMIVDRLLYKATYFYSDLRRTYLYTINASGGQAEQMTFGEFDYHSFSWSPDGQYLACVSNRTGRDDFNSNTDIMYVSVKDKKMMQRTYTEGPEYQVNISPDGQMLAYKGRIRSNRSKESDAELIKIYTMPVKEGKPVELTASLDRWADDFEWDPQGKKVYFTVQNEGRVELYASAEKGGTPTALITDTGQVGTFSVAKDGTIFYTYNKMDELPEVYRFRPKNATKEKITAFNQDFQQQVKIVGAEHFSYGSFDGQMIDGWIMKPANYEEGKKYPLVFDIHGGPHGQYGYRVSDRLQEFAAAGYAVLFINPRGSTGKGQVFCDEVVGDIGGGDYRDLMVGLDYAIGNYSFIDAENMGVTGISYGGYLTNWVTTHSHRFKAAVPISGIGDLVDQWTDGANSDWFESDMGFMPPEDYERTWNVSPMKYIHGCTTPTLFVKGQFDFITSLDQDNAMFVAMKKLGVEAQLAIYPNEGHGIAREPRHTADYHQRTIAWFDKYLKK